MGFCFAGAYCILAVLPCVLQASRAASKQEGVAAPPLLRRLQLHKLVDHSFQSVEHDIIAEDKHLQSPFLLVQQHGLTRCARHVVDVLYGATCNLLTVELDNDRSCTATRFRHSLLKCVNHRCKRRFDVRSALLVAQYSKKFFVRWDDRAMCELRDIVVEKSSTLTICRSCKTRFGSRQTVAASEYSRAEVSCITFRLPSSPRVE